MVTENPRQTLEELIEAVNEGFDRTKETYFTAEIIYEGKITKISGTIKSWHDWSGFLYLAMDEYFPAGSDWQSGTKALSFKLKDGSTTEISSLATRKSLGFAELSSINVTSKPRKPIESDTSALTTSFRALSVAASRLSEAEATEQPFRFEHRSEAHKAYIEAMAEEQKPNENELLPEWDRFYEDNQFAIENYFKNDDDGKPLVSDEAVNALKSDICRLLGNPTVISDAQAQILLHAHSSLDKGRFKIIVRSQKRYGDEKDIEVGIIVKVDLADKKVVIAGLELTPNLTTFETVAKEIDAAMEAEGRSSQDYELSNGQTISVYSYDPEGLYLNGGPFSNPFTSLGGRQRMGYIVKLDDEQCTVNGVDVLRDGGSTYVECVIPSTGAKLSVNMPRRMLGGDPDHSVTLNGEKLSVISS